MAHPGWYPPGQVCYPPELPAYLKSVHDLKPIVGVPYDAEVIGIHDVIHAAKRVSVVPEMNNPGLLMRLTDHLFSVQMAKYRSRYSLITFPSDATYTPPSLPAHVSTNLESVSGAPTDQELMKAQDAVQTYQELRRFPTMFDAHVNMELCQHLFDLQMARHMRVAGETLSNLAPQETSSQPRSSEHTPQVNDDVYSATNNAGTGASAAGTHHLPQVATGNDSRELMEQSNRLIERLGQLLERSNELAERSTPPADHSNQLTERFNQVLERFTQAVDRSHHAIEPMLSDRLVERLDQFLNRFTQVFERASLCTDQLVEQFNQIAERSNQLIEGSNKLAEQPIRHIEMFNMLYERLGQHFGQISDFTEALVTSVTKSGDVLENISKVLAGIQHAIFLGRKGFKPTMLDCLVNEKGKTFAEDSITSDRSLRVISSYVYSSPGAIPVRINGTLEYLSIPEDLLGELLRYYGIGEGLCEDRSTDLLPEKIVDAKKRLSYYLSSYFG